MRIFSQGWSDNKDAPGVRWIIYLKGCNFRCLYCGNPEGINPEKEIMFYPERVKKVPPEKVCPRNMACHSCSTFECVDIWHHPAFEKAGKEISVEEIVKKAESVRYMADGVTFGGGEPTLQAEELFAALDALKTKGIHTAVESNAGTEVYKELAGRTDYLISDLKAGSPGNYLRLTGCDGTVVRKNLLSAAAKQKELLIRIPLIPGFNTSEEEQEKMKDFLVQMLSVREKLCVQTLRLHHAGSAKYRALKKNYALENVDPPTEAMQQNFNRMLSASGLTILDFNNREQK